MNDVGAIALSGAIAVVATALVLIVRWSLTFAREEDEEDRTEDRRYLEIATDGLDSQALFHMADDVVKLSNRATPGGKRVLLDRATDLRLLAHRRASEERAAALERSQQKTYVAVRQAEASARSDNATLVEQIKSAGDYMANHDPLRTIDNHSEEP